MSRPTCPAENIEFHSAQHCTRCNITLSLLFVNDTEELPLREAKRRATRAAIEEHATFLVAERGIDDVTVEDICAVVGISKRTFFNYVDSKETAIFGDPPRFPSERERSEFLSRRHENLVGAVLALCSELVLSTHLLDSPQGTEILRRRKEIRRHSPELILQRHASFHEIHKTLRDLLTDYYQAYPDALLTGSAVDRESAAVVSVASTALQLGYMNWLNGTDNSPAALGNACSNALTDITTLIKGKTV